MRRLTPTLGTTVGALTLAALLSRCSQPIAHPAQTMIASSATPQPTPSDAARTTCGYTASETTTDRTGTSRIAGAEYGYNELTAPVGIYADYDEASGKYMDPATGNEVQLETVPTYVLTGNGGLRLGTRRTDSNGPYQQVDVPQSAEAVASLDGWDRAYPDVIEQWSRQDFYLAQDFAVCFLLTWYLDNPAVADRTEDQLETYAADSAELIPAPYRGQWTDAATNIDHANSTSPSGPMSPVGEVRVVAPYDPSRPRYTLVTLRIREVALGNVGHSLAFEIAVKALYPSISVPHTDGQGDVLARADRIVTVGVQLVDGVPYLVALT